MKVRRVVLSGATGYLGGRLMARLDQLDDFHAIPLVRTEEQATKFDQSCIVIGTDGELVADLVRAKPNAVLHIAASGGVQSGIAELGEIVRSNITLGALMMQACAESENCCFVGIGSFAQHSVTETTVHPNSLYAASKTALEAFGDYYAAAHSVRSTFLLLTDVYGSDDPRRRLLALLAHATLTGTGLPVTRGDQIVSFVHVEDVIDAILHSLSSDTATNQRSPRRYGIRGPEVLTLRETVDLLEKELSVAIPAVWGERAYRSNEVMRPQLLNGPPGWAPLRSVVDGFQELLETVL